MFQFHTGSIKSYADLDVSGIETVFQFHTGSIKSGFQIGTSIPTLARFNSTLVRLKGCNGAGATFPDDTFQFHTGSIKSRAH